MLFFLSKVTSYFFLCFVVLVLNNNSVDSVIVFYIIPAFTHSSLVLNLNEFFLLLKINAILNNVENQTVADPQ